MEEQLLEASKQALALAFNEWMRRYEQEPERFERELTTLKQFMADENEGRMPSLSTGRLQFFVDIGSNPIRAAVPNQNGSSVLPCRLMVRHASIRANGRPLNAVTLEREPSFFIELNQGSGGPAMPLGSAYARLAQLVEQLLCKQLVAGSTPARGSRNI